jgi:hypothetical protein
VPPTCQPLEGGRGPRLTCGLMCRLVAAYSGFMSCISGGSPGAWPAGWQQQQARVRLFASWAC